MTSRRLKGGGISTRRVEVDIRYRNLCPVWWARLTRVWSEGAIRWDYGRCQDSEKSWHVGAGLERLLSPFKRCWKARDNNMLTKIILLFPVTSATCNGQQSTPPHLFARLNMVASWFSITASIGMAVGPPLVSDFLKRSGLELLLQIC
jgi:hypothetical protein